MDFSRPLDDDDHFPSPRQPFLPSSSYTSRRSPSASTVSTTHSAQSGIPARKTVSPRLLGLQLGSSPMSSGMGMPTTSYTADGTDNGWDEADKLGYQYSLRVAMLHQYLSNQSRSPITTSNSVAASFSTPPMPPMPSPSLQGTSPSGSRLTFSSFSRESPASTNGGVSPGVGKRKSSFGLNIGRKSEADGMKLPKEFLMEFWGTLANEDGDAGWKTATGSFLGMIKKGTKTPSGMNLREIPTLLEAFTALLPPISATYAAPHVHQSHLLQLLYNSLPRSSHFSPMARPQSEKDKDQLFRLRAEVQSYLLVASPDITSDSTSNEFAVPNGLNGGSTKSPAGGTGLGRAHSDQSGHSQDSIRRKPSPVWNGDQDGVMGEMMETVGQVWGVAREVMKKDVAGAQRSGPLDQNYMNDLKRALSSLSAVSSPLSPTQKSRQLTLAASLGILLKDFPELGTPGSPADYAPASPSTDYFVTPKSAPAFFYIPPRMVEVFARLTVRAGEAGLGPKTRDLVEKCRVIWGIESCREKEKEVEGLIARWSDTIGTREELEWGINVADGVKDLSVSLPKNGPLPPVLESLLGNLLALLSTSISSIFPSTSVPPSPPPPSILPILNAAPGLFLTAPRAVKTISKLSDELTASAIGEYVAAVGSMMGGVGQDGEGARKIGESGKDQMVEGFEKVAVWMDKEVSNVRKVWGNALGALNPAAIILSKQLPLFCAELQIISRPRSPASDVFTLYEVTGRILEAWEDLCPGQELGFELDHFFEPHVLAWLRDTEDNNTHDWVSRAVGMDSWVPEGDKKHSQSVIDLFDFIRGSAGVILNDLPLCEYKRAMYLIDLSKTISIAVTQYASTVLALFMSDMNPAKASTPTLELQNKLGSKAGSWLAKGQQAVKNMDKRKIEGVMTPPVACVKLTDMSAAQACLEDLSLAMEADVTTRIVQTHKPRINGVEKLRHIFTVTVMRGENLLGKGLNKPADAFVIITDRETGDRLLKSRTVLGAEDPRWEQSLEMKVGNLKTLELAVFDRQLVGKHDTIGSGTFKLDPRLFVEHSTRDVLLPLSTRGTVHLRISMEGGEKHDIEYHLSSASRALERSAGDMQREIVDKMGEFIRSTLSVATLQGLTKPLKDKKKAKTAVSESDLEGSLGPLFEYFNLNFSVFSATLTETSRLRLMLFIWRKTIDTLISLLVPPLSDKPHISKDPLGLQEIDVVLKWLQLLKAFFNASENGVEHGVPLSQLQAGPYRDIIILGQYLDLPTQALRDRASAAVKAAGRPQGVVAGMKGLSLEEDNDRMAEVLLRIARTRPDMGEFLAGQIGLLTKARVEKQGGML